MNFKPGDKVMVIENHRPVHTKLPVGSIHIVTRVSTWSGNHIRINLLGYEYNSFYVDRFILVNPTSKLKLFSHFREYTNTMKIEVGKYYLTKGNFILRCIRLSEFGEYFLMSPIKDIRIGPYIYVPNEMFHLLFSGKHRFGQVEFDLLYEYKECKTVLPLP